MPKAHKCERFHPSHRGQKRCRYCNRVWYLMPDKTWRPSMTISQFGNKWLPAISGTNPTDMMRIDVAFPFEWNCYESWNVVYRVTFDFSQIGAKLNPNLDLSTRIDVMDGWQSRYHEDLSRLDFEAEQEYAERTGRKYDIGDNTYDEMRRIIQA
jgi:hypothetical protein